MLICNLKISCLRFIIRLSSILDARQKTKYVPSPIYHFSTFVFDIDRQVIFSLITVINVSICFVAYKELKIENLIKCTTYLAILKPIHK